MTYDAIIITYNRPGILSVSIPTILNQDVPPETLVVVDASTQENDNQSYVESLSHPTTEVKYLRHDPAPVAQRIFGAEQGRSPVVVFPDDDSIFYPEAFGRLMRIYEADDEKRVAAVMFGEAKTPPPWSGLQSQETLNSSPMAKLKYRFGALRADIENFLAPTPVRTLGERLTKQRILERGLPDWIGQLGAKLDRNLQGFRMSLRREAIVGFSSAEVFGKNSMYEDEVFAMEALQQGLILSLTGGEVYHHRVVGGRSSHETVGFYMGINAAFLVLKLTSPGSLERRQLLPSLRMRIKGYKVRKSEEAQDKAKGLEAALALASEALSLSQDRIDGWYVANVGEWRARKELAA